jgi:hypothetical protein
MHNSRVGGWDFVWVNAVPIQFHPGLSPKCKATEVLPNPKPPNTNNDCPPTLSILLGIPHATQQAHEQGPGAREGGVHRPKSNYDPSTGSSMTQMLSTLPIIQSRSGSNRSSQPQRHLLSTRTCILLESPNNTQAPGVSITMAF